MSRDAWQDRHFAAQWDEAGNLLTNPDRLRQVTLLADLLAASGARRLLDLGIGSAQVEAAVNRRHPDFFAACRVTGIDASAAMLELAEQRRVTEKLATVELIQQDFRSIRELQLAEPPDAVICVQALHEVAHDVKRGVFAWVHEQLAPGRPLLVLDRFDYPEGPWLDDWRATWNWMREEAPAEVLDFDEYHRRYRAKTDHVASLDQYRDWLEQAGFETRCPYRCFNRALIVARA